MKRGRFGGVGAAITPERGEFEMDLEGTGVAGLINYRAAEHVGDDAGEPSHGEAFIEDKTGARGHAVTTLHAGHLFPPPGCAAHGIGVAKFQASLCSGERVAGNLVGLAVGLEFEAIFEERPQHCIEEVRVMSIGQFRREVVTIGVEPGGSRRKSRYPKPSRSACWG